MEYSVEIINIEPVRVAYMTHEGPVMEANSLFPAVFGAIGEKINGAPFFIYHEMNPQTFQGIVDVCEATAEESTDPAVKTKVVPGCRALMTKHVGPYDTIYMAYQAISKYAAENGHGITGPNREIFEKGPHQENDPANFVTYVVVPLAGEE